MNALTLVRPAHAQDLYGLMSIRPQEPLHRERLTRQQEGEWTYLVAVDDHGQGAVCGFVVLIWGGDEHHHGYPMLSDLVVRETRRGQGIGTRLIERAEWLCQEREFTQIGLSVNPSENPRAYALYARLGYQQTSESLHCYTSYITDEQGHFFLSEDWRVAMRKDLRQEI
jgi:GNAT superfamily N-acetyltransferase